MSEWHTIETAPDDGNQILVGFAVQHFKWFSFVADAHGKNTGRHTPYPPPTHWMPITPPSDG